MLLCEGLTGVDELFLVLEFGFGCVRCTSPVVWWRCENLKLYCAVWQVLKKTGACI